MTGKEIIQKVKEKVCSSITQAASDSDTGKGKSKMSKQIKHGYHLVEGKSGHAMEDYVFAEFRQVDENELGLFAIFDGHPDFWTATDAAIRRAYRITDSTILEKAKDLGKGGSTAVTAILINCRKLVVANVGDSRAVICKNGVAKQLSIDHEPERERDTIENKGGFVSKFPGDVPRVDGQLAVARAFGDKTIKDHLSSEPDVIVETIDDETEFMILASDGVWKVMSNEEAVKCIRQIKDAKSAAKRLNEEALARKSTDDISCIVVRFA
ncbi:probable protein phosphatase 2C 39 isoform X3 [Salvia hispanica]|uniref:probable protein phosphatase 2C 39 isoform X3 n=1 Tax=Salvia hispanica TaxID=49212 RepID=UPI0020090FE8|nr:probable protein phosphatase 2C 39 isoform X3 [Salvia hispanica]